MCIGCSVYMHASRRDAPIRCAHVHGMHISKYLFTARVRVSSDE